MNKKFLYTILTSIALFLLLYPNSTKARIRIEKGQLNIQSWNFEKNDPIKLDGQWEFYWKQLLYPEDFLNAKIKNIEYFTIPNSWNSYKINKKNLSGTGYATYRLLIKTNYKKTLSLNRIYPNSAYKLWINGKLLSQSGKVHSDINKMSPQQKSEIITFKAVNSLVEIIIQISNKSFNTGGLWHSISLGSKKKIEHLNITNIAYDLFIFGSLLIMGLYYLGLFALRKKDRSTLWFGLFTLLIALRTLSINEIFLLHYFPNIPWEIVVKTNMLTYAIGIPLFLLFVSYTYKNYKLKVLNIFIYLTSLLYTVFIIFSPAILYSRLISYFNILSIVVLIYIIIIVVRGVINKKNGSIISLIGFLILCFSVVNDILSVNDIIHTPQMVPLGFFFFILMQSLNLSKRFAIALDRSEELSVDLNIKVKERTSELEKERNKLKERHEKLEKDLAMAKRIQQQFIPNQSPYDFISAIYKPMEQTGGDLYDFFKFRNSEQIGIFLSDVSGHGVSAAFITSMIKTTILQSGENRNDPSLLLKYLNDMLINQTAGNFITAFYCIYNRKSKSLTYASAGHNWPYMVSDSGVKSLEGKRGLPLCVIDNDSMHKLNKSYTNNLIFLEDVSKLFLYTDGLTEATPFNDTEKYYEDERLLDILLQSKDLSSQKFTDAIYKDLVDFRQIPDFDDDICIICLDLKDI